MPGKKSQPHELIAFANDEYLVETVQDKSGLIFAVCDSLGAVKLDSGFYIGPNEYKPYHNDQLLTKKAILLPPAPIPYRSQHELLKELREFIESYLSCPDWWTDLAAHYVLLTWVYQRFNSLPYLRVIGGADLGKSRFLALMEELCYRACNMTCTMGPAVIYRVIQRYRVTLIIDEFNPVDSSNKSDTIHILNKGYCQRGNIIKCSRDNDWQTNNFDPFGPKIVAGHEEFRDASFESRCFRWVPIRHKIPDRIPRQEPPVLKEQAHELRGKLLQWRFENYRSIVIEEENLKMLGTRPCELATALYSVSKDYNFKNWLIGYVANQKQEEDSASAKTWIVDLIKNTPGDTLSLKTIAEAYNDTVDKPDWLWSKQVGRLVRELGIDTRRLRDGYHATGLTEFRRSL